MKINEVKNIERKKEEAQHRAKVQMDQAQGSANSQGQHLIIIIIKFIKGKDNEMKIN